MTDPVTNESIFEILKNLQARANQNADDMGNVKARLTSIDTRLGLIHTDMAYISGRMDKLENRLERVEKRLSLNDPSH